MKSIALVVNLTKEVLGAAQKILGEEVDFYPVDKDAACLHALDSAKLDMAIIEQSVSIPGDLELLSAVRRQCGDLPILFVLEAVNEKMAGEVLRRGATDCVIKSEFMDVTLSLAIRRHIILADLRRSLAAAQTKLQFLLKAQRLKQHFLELISHDLRSPLLTARTYAQLLASGRLGALSAQQKDKLEVILRSADRLARSTDQLRRFARLESGKIELVRATFDLKSLFTEVLAGVSRQCLEKGITLGQSWPPSPMDVYADRELMAEVLKEMLENALAFTPEKGSIAVAITERPQGEAVVSVTDTGGGISAEKRLHLFESIWDRDEIESKRHGGYGLGLAFVKRIMDLHGSKLEVDSQPGQGARLRFTLPLVQQASESRLMAGLGVNRRKIVLAVDDDEDNLACTRTVLEMAGYEVLGANGFAEAKEQLEQGTVDAVLLDVALADASGLETLRLLKHYPATSSLPVVMVSGCAEDDTRAQAAHLGAAAFVVKPFTPAKLLRELSQAMSHPIPSQV